VARNLTDFSDAHAILFSSKPAGPFPFAGDVMKTSFLHPSSVLTQTKSLVLALLIGLPISPQSVVAADDGTKLPALVTEKSRQLQEKMSDLFRDTWKELRESVKSKTQDKSQVTMASVDVREQNDGYIIRMHLPGRDMGQIEVTFTDHQFLRIVAPADKKSGRYEQTLILDGVPDDAKPEIERRPADKLIVIHIPKATTATKPSSEPEPKSIAALPAPNEFWDRDILSRMDAMRREMDEMFHQTFKEFDDLPDPETFFDKSKFGSSFDLQNEEKQYIVRAYLPDRNAENIKVTVNGRILKIEATAENITGKNTGDSQKVHKSYYAQMLSLPGEVDSDNLKVDRKNGMLVISTPKKKRD
jgi:HSP20 family protein